MLFYKLDVSQRFCFFSKKITGGFMFSGDGVQFDIPNMR